MKIKRFFASDIRQAMRMVKEELGADAVIMSNRSVDGGVEIVAARDFDEQAIHENLQEQAKSRQRQAGEQKLELPDFAAEKKHLHIISSQRKHQADQTQSSRPAARKLDQYLDTAAQLSTRPAARKAPPGKSGGAAHKKPKRQPATGHQASTAVSAAQQSTDKILLEMRQELTSLRSALDDRFSAANTVRQEEQKPLRLDLLRRLAGMGIDTKLAIKIANRLDSHTDSELAWQHSLSMLSSILPLADDRLLEEGGIAALVGPTGVGKTTTIAKLAAQFILQHGPGQVALITTDNYRIAAHEQLNTYGRILDVPVGVAADGAELDNLLQRFSDKRLILIDTAGMSQRDMRLAEHISMLRQSHVAIKAYLVMSAATQLTAMHEIIDAFQAVQPEAGILTKLDEAASKGAAISAVIEQQLPLAYVTDGQEVPRDLHVPRAEALVAECTVELQQVQQDLSWQEQNWVAQGYV